MAAVPLSCCMLLGRISAQMQVQLQGTEHIGCVTSNSPVPAATRRGRRPATAPCRLLVVATAVTMLLMWVKHTTMPSARALLHVGEVWPLLGLLLALLWLLGVLLLWLLAGELVGAPDRNHCRYLFSSFTTYPVPKSTSCARRSISENRRAPPAASRCFTTLEAAASLYGCCSASSPCSKSRRAPDDCCRGIGGLDAPAGAAAVLRGGVPRWGRKMNSYLGTFMLGCAGTHTRCEAEPTVMTAHEPTALGTGHRWPSYDGFKTAAVVPAPRASLSHHIPCSDKIAPTTRQPARLGQPELRTRVPNSELRTQTWMRPADEADYLGLTN